MKKWQTTDSKILVNDRWLKLRADTCVTPDGHTIAPFYVLECSTWVNCVVIDSDNHVVMVRHYRHGIDDFVLEHVSGGVDTADASPIAAVRRELEEEIGYAGGEIYQTGMSYPNPSSQTNTLYSFIAVGGKCTMTQSLEDGENLERQYLSFKEFIEYINDPNAIHHSLSLAASLFAINFIKSSQLESLQGLRSFV